MINKKQMLSRVQLYVIADPNICGAKDICDVVRQAIDGGAEMIQYRDKDSNDDNFLHTASKLSGICREKGVPFIVNDRVEIALKMVADGVHVGQEDLSVEEAKRILGSERIIGKSAETIQQAKQAEAEGADYVGIGPVFDTASKKISQPIGLDIIRQARESLRIPFFAIGGIDLNNVDQVIQAGGNRIAVISVLMLSGNIGLCATKLSAKLKVSF
ncbi:MAG: thiamine phosphate synthase [Candidatus Zixiibacteriota bacterium]